MKNLIKFYDFAVVCVFILGLIGCSAYLFYDHHFLFGVTSIVVSAMALPYVISRGKDIEK